MTNEQKLHALALASQPEWAKTIRKRNQELLKRLKLLIPYIGESRIPRTVQKQVMAQVGIGCPHCMAASRVCVHCLYATVLGHQCVELRFGDDSLESVPFAAYSETQAWIVLYPNAVVSGDDLKRAMKFVQAHIQWTRDPDWGKEA